MFLKGLDEMLETVNHLQKRGAERAARKGLNAGAQVAVKAVRAAAPVRTGTLRKSIGKRVDRTRDRTKFQAKIGPRKGTAGGRYAHLVHNGFIDRSGTFRPGTPFIEGPIDQQDGTIKSAIAAKLGSAIEQEAQRAAGGGR
jgi:HK97 gp10 family phage protein